MVGLTQIWVFLFRISLFQGFYPRLFGFPAIFKDLPPLSPRKRGECVSPIDHGWSNTVARL